MTSNQDIISKTINDEILRIQEAIEKDNSRGGVSRLFTSTLHNNFYSVVPIHNWFWGDEGWDNGVFVPRDGQLVIDSWCNGHGKLHQYNAPVKEVYKDCNDCKFNKKNLNACRQCKLFDRTKKQSNWQRDPNFSKKAIPMYTNIWEA